MTNSPIQWTDNTWNPWLGCRKVSPGCDNCYIVRTTPYRTRKLKHGGVREALSVAYWKQPLLWNRRAERENRRIRVFPSLCDWLDDEVPIEWLANFLDLIRRTPHLDWQLLTKRPQNFQKRIDEVNLWTNNSYQVLTRVIPANIWLGVSVENQKYADERIPLLLGTPAKIRFLSCEPLLGPVDIWWALRTPTADRDRAAQIKNENLRRMVTRLLDHDDMKPQVDWVICGGESDDSKITKARPMHPDWARSLRDRCQAANVPFFFKQWGEWLPLCQSDNDDCIPQLGTESLPVHIWPESKFPGIRTNGDCVGVGKKRAGRILDGRTHDAMPA